MADRWEVTNISVSKDVDTVKLHNLSPGLHYTVSVATQMEGGTFSSFSLPLSLTSATISPILPPSSLPNSVWIIAMTIVVILTLLTIAGVTTIVIRLRGLHRVHSNPGSITSNNTTIGNFWRHKRMAWMDPRCMQHTHSGSALNVNSVNSQAVASEYSSVNTSEHCENVEDMEAGEDGNHYAYIDIVGGVRDDRRNTCGYR